MANGGPVTKTFQVTLIKGDRGFGFSIAGGKDQNYKPGDQGFFITSIFQDTPAHRVGSLKVDDKILEINGQKLDGLAHDQAVHILRTSPSISMTVQRMLRKI